MLLKFTFIVYLHQYDVFLKLKDAKLTYLYIYFLIMMVHLNVHHILTKNLDFYLNVQGYLFNLLSLLYLNL